MMVISGQFSWRYRINVKACHAVAYTIDATKSHLNNPDKRRRCVEIKIKALNILEWFTLPLGIIANALKNITKSF